MAREAFARSKIFLEGRGAFCAKTPDQEEKSQSDQRIAGRLRNGGSIGKGQDPTTGKGEAPQIGGRLSDRGVGRRQLVQIQGRVGRTVSRTRGRLLDIVASAKIGFATQFITPAIGRASGLVDRLETARAA